MGDHIYSGLGRVVIFFRVAMGGHIFSGLGWVVISFQGWDEWAYFFRVGIGAHIFSELGWVPIFFQGWDGFSYFYIFLGCERWAYLFRIVMILPNSFKTLDTFLELKWMYVFIAIFSKKHLIEKFNILCFSLNLITLFKNLRKHYYVLILK